MNLRRLIDRLLLRWGYIRISKDIRAIFYISVFDDSPVYATTEEVRRGFIPYFKAWRGK